MVFTVAAPTDSKTDFIEEGDVEKGNAETTLPESPPVYYTKRAKRNRCCLVLPWLLFFVCFLMLGFAMCWGWNQHRQLLKLQKDKNDNMFDNQIGDDSTDFDKRLPYGNDALFPASDDNDFLVDEDVIGFDNQRQPGQDDGNSFGILTISLPGFDDVINHFFGNVQFDNFFLPQSNDTDVTTG